MSRDALQPLRPRRAAPAGCMLAASGIEALIPVAVAVTVGSSDVLLFGTFVSIGLAVGAGGLLATLYRSAICWHYIRSRVFCVRHIWRRDFVLSVFGRFEYPAFVLASAQIGVARTSIIWGVYPLAYVALLDRSTRAADGSGRYRRFTLSHLAMLGVAFVGLAFTVASRPASGVMGAGSGTGVALGVAAAGVAALCAAFNSLNIVWGMELALCSQTERRGPRPGPLAGGGLERTGERIEAACTIVGVLAAVAVTVPVLVLVTAAFGGFEVSFVSVSGGVAIGVFLLTPPVVLARLANLRTQNLGVNAISYLTPALAVGVLALCGRLGDVRPGFVVVGVAAIVAANLLLNLDLAVRRPR